jgi:hypothetical protein
VQKTHVARLKFPAPATMETWVTDVGGTRCSCRRRVVRITGRRAETAAPRPPPDRGRWAAGDGVPRPGRLVPGPVRRHRGQVRPADLAQGTDPRRAADAFAKVTCADDRAGRTSTSSPTPTSCWPSTTGRETVTLRKVTRRVPAHHGATRLLQLRSPTPGQAAYLTNQPNALIAPVEAAWRELDQAEQGAAAVPARGPARRPGPGHDAPGNRGQADHPRHLDGRLQRRDRTGTGAGRGPTPAPPTKPMPSSAKPSPHPATSTPGPGELLVRLDPLTAPGAPRPWPPSATSSARPRYATPARSHPALRSQNPPWPCLNDFSSHSSGAM